MANRLAGATSPYLVQHQDNPVDWWPWGEEAFEEARRLDRPVLLSVGYAACHWCHVMAHESFEDDATAAAMNAHFVNVKVDREEHPDVDAAYMAATQALTGHGGWPMTVFLTPVGRPFYAGTYFPPAPRHGSPSFRQVLAAVAETWASRRDEVESAGSRIAEALGRQGLPTSGPMPDAALTERAVAALGDVEDARNGGFGGAPKFPPAMVTEFLLRHAARVGAGTDSGAQALGIAGRALQAMARSGMYDQLAGGFARYAVDAAWVVPHFEKMLYDNALLARVYLHWWRLTGEPTGARIAVETCDWMLADLGCGAGPVRGLASSLDADTPLRDAAGVTHGVEGFTYVWTPAQLREALDEPDAGWAAELLRVTPRGTFEHGTSTLQLARDPWSADAPAGEAQRWEALRAKLLRVRQPRPQPARDDKVVAAWNGLAIAALAETGALLDRPDLVEAAQSLADLLLAVHLVPEDGGVRLRRVSRDGVVGEPPGMLEDYADVAEGLLALHAVTGEASWLTVAGRLLDTVLDHFEAGPTEGDGSFVDAAAPDAAVTAALGGRRPADPTDSATPSGTTAAAGALLSYAALTGSARHREAAERALGVVGALGAAAPQAIGWGLAVAEAWLDGPREVAVVGSAGSPDRAALHRAALASPAPGLVVSVGEPDAPDVPLLAGRPTGPDDAPLAYVCRHFTCDAPVGEVDALRAQLA